MSTHLCDRCGQLIEEDALRHVTKIQVYAAYNPLKIDFEDMTRDHTNDIKEILERCEDLTEEESMQDVYIDFQFDLCGACQRSCIKAAATCSGWRRVAA